MDTLAMTPRLIWQFWHEASLPPEIAGWAGQWRDLHRRTWHHELWDADDAEGFLHHKAPDLKRLWDATPDRYPTDVWRQRADILRCALLSVYGGIWLDTDMQSTGHTLNPLLPLGPTLCWERDSMAAIGLIATPPASPFIERVREGMPNAFWRKNKLTRHSDTPIGPHYWTSHLGPDVTVLARDVCYPYDWRTPRPAGPFPNSLMVHHWHSAPNKPAPDPHTQGV